MHRTPLIASRHRTNLLVAACVATVVLAGIATNAQTTPARSSNFDRLAANADAARDANRLDESVPLYRKALALRPAWKEGWWSLGTILYDQNSYAPAARAFSKLVSIDPKNGTAHLFLGLCQYQLNLDDTALANIRAAKELGINKDDQLETVLRYHEGMLLLRKRDYERAIDALKPVVVVGVRSEAVDVALGLAVLLMSPKSTPPEGSPERQIILRTGRAEHLSLLRKYDEAEKAYADLSQEYPDFPNMHYAFGRFFLAVDELGKAVQQFEEEIKRNPKHVRARMQIAATHYRVDSAAGIPYAAEVVKLEPTYPFGHYMLGLLLFDSGDTQRAIPELEAASRMVPREAQFFFTLGNAYAKAGRKEDAARARSMFRKLDRESQPAVKSSIYGDQSSGLESAGPTPQSSERKHP